MATEPRPWAGDEIPPGSDVIEVRVAELAQLFLSIDPSPFHEKDLDANAEEFIISAAKEAGADKPLALLVHLDQPAVMPDAGSVVRDAAHAFFARRSKAARQRLQQLFRTGRISLAIGLAFVTASLLAGDWLVRLYPDNTLAELGKEGLIIGGWVAMWRPLEIFLYDWWPIRNERRLYDRLARMPVRIVCTGGGQC